MKNLMLALLLLVTGSFASEWIYSNDGLSYYSRIEVSTIKRSKEKILGVWVKDGDYKKYVYFNCRERSSGPEWFMLDPIDPDVAYYTLMLNICDYEKGAKRIN